MKKKITLVVALALVLVVGVFGSLAWLTASTDEVTNTFTIGNIQITLTEPNAPTSKEYKVVPGGSATKDPTITVAKDSESCYVYACVTNTVKVTVNGKETVVATPNVNATNWVSVCTSGDKTLYRYKEIVNASNAAADITLPVFTTVTYSDLITKDNISEITPTTDKITVDAFAIQSEALTSGVTTADAEAAAHFEMSLAG